MDHALGVRGLERAAHVHRDVDRAPRHDPPAAGEQLSERPALDELHDDEVDAVVGPGVEDRHEVLVADPRGRLRLPAEPPDEVRVVGELRREDLDGHGPAEHRILAVVDLRHAAVAELVLDAIASAEDHRLIDRRSSFLAGGKLVQGYRPGSAGAGAKHVNQAWGDCPSRGRRYPSSPVTVTPELRATKLTMNVAAPATATRLDHSETPGFTSPSPEASGITASGGIGSGRFGSVSVMVDNPILRHRPRHRDNEQHLVQLHRTMWR